MHSTALDYPPVLLPPSGEEVKIEIIVISDDEDDISYVEIIAKKQQEKMEFQMTIDEEMGDFIDQDVDYTEDTWYQEE